MPSTIVTTSVGEAMMSSLRGVCSIALLLSTVLVLVGCAGGTAITDTAPQPVVLRVTSPVQLDVFLVVSMGGYTPATRDTTELHLGVGSGGRPVQFVADERVVCNDVALQRFIGAFDAMVPTGTVAGKLLSCRYTSGNASVTLALTLPSAPVILAPQNQARVPREAQTVVRYALPPGALSAVVALGPVSKASAGPGATGTTQTILDTRPLSAGAGSVTLTMDLALPHTPNPGFKSLGLRGTATTWVDVTWI